MNNDLISRQMTIEVVQNMHMMLSKEKVLLINDLENMPSAQPKRGRWIHDGSKWTNRRICSECGYKWFFDCIEGAYCPNCGADMREETT